MAFTFTVEDGTGVEGANAYTTVEAYQDYHEGRGRDVSGQTDEEIENHIVNATDYIDAVYGRNFVGQRADSGQALEWPRDYAYDDLGVAIEGLPAALVKACAELAFIASGRTLAPNPAPQIDSNGNVAASGAITRKLERVEGAVTEETEYAAPVSGLPLPGSSAPTYPLVDRIMSAIVRPPCPVRA